MENCLRNEKPAYELPLAKRPPCFTEFSDSCTVACLDARFARQIVRQELVFVIY